MKQTHRHFGAAYELVSPVIPNRHLRGGALPSPTINLEQDFCFVDFGTRFPPAKAPPAAVADLLVQAPA
jgi:hypothetical protein